NKVIEKTSLVEEELKALRIKIAKKYSIFPVYNVFNNSQMTNLIKAKPKTLDDLKKVDGFGDVKVEMFGEDLVDFFKSKYTDKEINNKNVYDLLIELRPKIAQYNKLDENEVYSDKVA